MNHKIEVLDKFILYCTNISGLSAGIAIGSLVFSNPAHLVGGLAFAISFAIIGAILYFKRAKLLDEQVG